MNLPDKLKNKIIARVENDSFRNLKNQNNLIDFSSNDYLGFSKHNRIAQQVKLHLEEFKNINGSTGSRLISGNQFIYQEVELELANFFNTPAALLFNSGYDANLGLLSCVPQHGDLILFDELCHASIRDGIRLSNAKAYSFKHNSLSDLKKKFRNVQRKNAEIYLVVESIYSMDGDQAPLKEIAEFCKKNKIYFIVDEAHATGVFGSKGNGLVNDLKIEKEIFARVHTFGKALGCHGAVVVGSKELRAFLINFARSFIYTTAIPIHNVLTIKYAIKELLITNEVNKLKIKINFFKKELLEKKIAHLFIDSNSPIQACIISGNNKANEVANKIKFSNFNVKAILSPTVPVGKERIRFCIHSYNSSNQIREILKLLSTFV
ncbi:MAG: pyridoxal phosphate-dependent aminotransferase family protein [Flavobacteriaceae bacterium]|nr:pyridoxal phosphate-dependent aminotransferase family protein [Flavobacteriaceae bacterium]